MSSRIIKTISTIFTIIAIILTLLTIYMLILKLIGHSPTETTITYSILGTLVAFQIMITGILFQIKEDLGNLKEFKRQTINKISEIENKI